MIKKTINLHLVSDSTGETLLSVARAALSQFEGVETKEFIWSLTRSETQLNKIKESIKKDRGIVMYTILQDNLIMLLKKYCDELEIPCLPVLTPIVNAFSNYLGMDTNKVIGRQHSLDKQYFSKVEAINYTMCHDDGQANWDLYEADIILIGVSRTSKSPTSIYLSCRGYKTANIPFVTIDSFPKTIFDLKKPLIVGLIINPEKLIQIRQSRLASIGQDEINGYTDLEAIKNEIAESRKLFAKLNCPIIDVTKKSVEETAARIIQLLQDKK